MLPDSAPRAEVRKELSIEPDAPLIGMLARFDPQKDHRSPAWATSSDCSDGAAMSRG